MNLTDKKYLYINGSSISEAGGFEEYQYRNDVRDEYKNANITLNDKQEECSYGYFISKELNLKLVNESKSGSGVERLIRKTTSWIFNNEDKIKDTLFLLEPQPGIRLDWFVKKWNSYGILNAAKNEQGKYPFTLVKQWYKDNRLEQISWNEEFLRPIDNFFDNFFDEDIQFEKEINTFLFFITWLNSRKINYLITLPNALPLHIEEELKKIIPFYKNLNNIFDNLGVWEYSKKNKWLISDEVNHTDNHIGFNGNKFVANKIIKHLKNPYEIKLYDYSNEVPSLINQFKHLNINFNLTNFENCEIITLDNIRIWLDIKNEDGQKKVLEDLRQLSIYNQLKKTNKFVLFYVYEEYFPRDYYQIFLNLISKELEINKKQILFLDCGTKIRQDKLPFQFKINCFSFLKSFKTGETEIKHKLTFLNNKTTQTRFLGFDAILNGYENDFEKMKSENLISFRNVINGAPASDITKIAEWTNKHDLYNKIEIPWILDDLKGGSYQDNHYQSLKLFEASIFGLVCETSYPNLYLNIEPLIEIDSFAFSEKTLIPILSKNMVFFIHHGTYYQFLEKQGFDFSYLKDIFDIDYKLNSLQDNLRDIYKIGLFIKDKSLKELLELRAKYNNILENNKNLLVSFFKECNSDTIEFIKYIKDEINK